MKTTQKNKFGKSSQYKSNLKNCRKHAGIYSFLRNVTLAFMFSNGNKLMENNLCFQVMAAGQLPFDFFIPAHYNHRWH